MDRSAIYLSGWLTTALAGVAIIAGMASGAFASPAQDTAQDAPSATPTVGILQGQDLIYVYPDGSPAPAPSSADALTTAAQIGSAAYSYDDDEREGHHGHDYDDDDD